MKIGIDGRFIGTPGGLGRYTEELLRAMLPFAKAEQFVVFVRPAGVARLKDLAGSITLVAADVPWYGVREQLEMPGLVRSARLDVMHWMHWNVPFLASRPFAATIHDLILLDHPTHDASLLPRPFFAMKHLAFHLTLRRAVSRAARILTPTIDVASRVMERFPTAATCVVTGEGVTRLPAVSREEQQRVIETLGIRGSYVLYVGNTYPHKNLETLFLAWEKLVASSPETSFVIAGHDDRFFARAVARVREMSLPRVQFVPSPDDATVSVLYANARVFVMPSLAEGFGLPSLEAMVARVPVIASDIPVFREVLGDAACLVDPRSATAIARAMGQLLQDEKMRTMMQERGEQRARIWQWSAAAQKTLAVYRDIHGNHAREENRGANE